MKSVTDKYYEGMYEAMMGTTPNIGLGPGAMHIKRPPSVKTDSADHWSWVIGLLESAKPLTEYLYRTAYEHGVKHGKVEAKDD
ncbi:MAG: hypothetical protein DRJ03_04675 [Chloroflexi bacterium]|nr:MAG: hypothetical protein DRJ03_04675 [Chloroflexota bacterium]